jgi:hypothetical protein
MFVITVAPQKDICPHGRTYPRKAVAITSSRRANPVDHTSFLFLAEEKAIPRDMCMYSRMKNSEAPFMCINRAVCPFFTSRDRWITDLNASWILDE